MLLESNNQEELKDSNSIGTSEETLQFIMNFLERECPTIVSKEIVIEDPAFMPNGNWLKYMHNLGYVNAVNKKTGGM